MIDSFKILILRCINLKYIEDWFKLWWKCCSFMKNILRKYIKPVLTNTGRKYGFCACLTVHLKVVTKTFGFFTLYCEMAGQISEKIHIRHCMVFLQSSIATVATKNIYVYPNTLDVRKSQSLNSVIWSYSLVSIRKTNALRQWHLKGKSGSKSISDNQRNFETNIGLPPYKFYSRLGK